jgi:hypothetical protein
LQLHWEVKTASPRRSRHRQPEARRRQQEAQRRQPMALSNWTNCSYQLTQLPRNLAAIPMMLRESRFHWRRFYPKV